MDVSFYGVRGSTPCCEPDIQRYGGSTSCVVLTRDGSNPLILDLGTGLRRYGRTLDGGPPFRGNALVTHLHWDHVQGLPFFAPVLCDGSDFTVWAPRGESANAKEAFDRFVAPPYFPVGMERFPGQIEVRDLDPGTFELDGWTITAAEVPHVGFTFAFRIEASGRSVVYVPDHQQPTSDPSAVDPAVVELARGCDLLIHDAQFTPERFEINPDWGHCTIPYAVHVAAAAQVGTLALFHHDPTHSDERLDQLHAEAVALAKTLGTVEVLCASESDVVALLGSERIDIGDPGIVLELVDGQVAVHS